tara:strand:- start:222 stop:671 length:450 start_codon:yes stop_codon:yes gene_type:complete
MIKKIFVLILLFSLQSCGYEAMYLKKIDFKEKIKSFETLGDKKINRNIISSLNLKNQNKTKGYKLIINSSKTLQIISKDKAGNSSVYKTLIVVKVSLIDNKETLKEKVFSEQFTYNNIKNKFSLSQYQKEIEINLINKIIDEVIIFLTI